VVDYYSENLVDRWTIQKLIRLPHSLLGDGLFDAVQQQDQLNEVNSLLIKNIRFATVGHKVYDANVIDPKDVVNDPENGWIPARPSVGVALNQSIQDLRPTALSQDVAAWRASLKESMQDMTSAYDPAVGKALGANTPYSQSVFLSEKAQARWKESVRYNRPELTRFWKQLLKLARDNWIDERTRALIDNTGEWSFQKFIGADLDGSVDIVLAKEDFKPQSRAEQVQSLTHLTEIMPLLPALPPRQKIMVEEMFGLRADANPMSTQIMRAFRMIDRMLKGEIVTPLPMVDDAAIQIPVFQDFLASEKGDDLILTNPEARANIFTYMVSLATMGMSTMASPAGQFMQQPGQPAAPSGSPPSSESKPPGGQPGQPGGGPREAGSGQESAQSPVPAKQPGAPYPAGTR
jgi:hypothetical protein